MCLRIAFTCCLVSQINYWTSTYISQTNSRHYTESCYKKTSKRAVDSSPSLSLQQWPHLIKLKFFVLILCFSIKASYGNIFPDMAASLGSRARDMKTISELFQFFKQPLRGKKDAVENPLFCSADSNKSRTCMMTHARTHIKTSDSRDWIPFSCH